MFYIRFNWDGDEHINSIWASLIYPFFYGSCTLSVFGWMFLSRMQVWNMGIFSNISNQPQPIHDPNEDEEKKEEETEQEKVKKWLENTVKLPQYYQLFIDQGIFYS